MRASYAGRSQTPQEPPMTAQTEDAAKLSTLEIGRLALRQALVGGAAMLALGKPWRFSRATRNSGKWSENEPGSSLILVLITGEILSYFT